MIEDRIKKSFFIKAIAYLLIPLLLIGMMVSTLIMTYAAEFPESRSEKSFYETKIFSDKYLNSIYSIYDSRKSITNSSRYENIYEYQNENDRNTIKLDIAVEAENRDKIYYSSRYTYLGIDFLILDKENNIWYTSVERTSKTDTVEKIKSILKSNGLYWNITNGQIETNIENISTENILRENLYEAMKSNSIELYTSFDTNNQLTFESDFVLTQTAYDITKKYYDTAVIFLPISVIIFFICSFYLIISTGHKNGKEGIYLDSFDKLPFELLVLFGGITLSIESLVIAVSIPIMRYNSIAMGITLFFIGLYIMGITLIFLVLGIIKRIKAGQLIRNTLIWRLLRLTKRICVKIVDTISENFSLSTKITIGLGGFIFVSFILVALRNIGGILLLLVFWLFVYIFLLKRATGIIKLQTALKNIYNGNTDISLNEKELRGVLREMAIYINDIAGGFSNAIQESLKSERLKTELITNVSHDIKTPLTSIINYVALLKKEDIKDETAKEYINILDSKSQRLKKLIDDLVEASKASSGNIKLEKQLININELIKQVLGEFEDKFKEKNLEIIAEYLKEDKKILADSRYIYRVVENIFSNVSKYALENSRVYVDIKQVENKVNILVKNISRERLNISEEELMQRFVRGDSSRNTEGSGLGLSIARSLTELQGGKFSIYLDGDLFKVIIEFEIKE